MLALPYIAGRVTLKREILIQTLFLQICIMNHLDSFKLLPFYLLLQMVSGLVTPCVRVCRYNADCYEGAVCVGCFREAYEIANWASLTPKERAFALQDAADRWEEGYPGSITKEELLNQASMWEELSNDG